MRAEEMAKTAKGEDVEELPVSQDKGGTTLAEGIPEDVSKKTNGEDVKNPQSTAETPKSEPKVHVSAHERDRQEQASRRVQEAQKYHTRDKGRGGGFRGGRGRYKNNSRFDPSKQEKSDDPIAIRKQVNLPKAEKWLFH